MKNSILAAALLGSAVMGGIIGGNVNRIQRDSAERAAWSDVIVLQGSTVVANPAALYPRELASATIIDPRDHITLCTDMSGKTFVNPKEGECENFKHWQHAS